MRVVWNCLGAQEGLTRGWGRGNRKLGGVCLTSDIYLHENVPLFEKQKLYKLSWNLFLWNKSVSRVHCSHKATQESDFQGSATQTVRDLLRLCSLVTTWAGSCFYRDAEMYPRCWMWSYRVNTGLVLVLLLTPLFWALLFQVGVFTVCIYFRITLTNMAAMNS